jgi:hypothetical protein
MFFCTLILSIITALAFFGKTIVAIIVYHFLHSKEDDKEVQRALCEVESDDVGQYKPPGLGDDRAPCPGLNSLANHGYLCVLDPSPLCIPNTNSIDPILVDS